MFEVAEVVLTSVDGLLAGLVCRGPPGNLLGDRIAEVALEHHLHDVQLSPDEKYLLLCYAGGLSEVRRVRDVLT